MDANIFYKSHKGSLNVDEMDEVHVKNVLKKLIRESLTPEGHVEVVAVDVTEASKALKALNTAKTAIAVMGIVATEEGEGHWQANIDLLTEVQVELSSLIRKETEKDEVKAKKAA
jgi:hypothetical protein